MENFLAPAESLARAESTFVRDVWMVAISDDALVCVEIDAVEVMVTIAPERLRFWAAVVMRREPSEDARAVISFVEPSTRLTPLKTAFFTIVVIWSRRAV